MREIATIAAIFSDGVTLKFADGSTSQKHYLTNKSAKLAVDDRVVVSNIGGTYVVDYAIGPPNTGT